MSHISCSDEDKQRSAADAKSAPPVERVRSEAASNIAQHGKTGTFGILHGNSITPNDPKCKNCMKHLISIILLYL